MFMKVFSLLLKISIGLVVIVIGLFYYLSNHTIENIAELQCSTYPKAFIKIEQYAPITKLWGSSSDGAFMVTFIDGTKRYFPNLTIIGDGNQKVVLINDEPDWERYVFGSQKLYYKGIGYDCF